MAFGYSERMEKRDNQVCKCGHKRHDHSYHYDNNQCLILGCGCVEFKKAAQQKDALDFPCTCVKFENGTKVFPMRECDGCRKTANQ